MTAFDKLLTATLSRTIRIAAVGDQMVDTYIHGYLRECQDGCPCFVESERVSVPGGAANTARQLLHWNVHVQLFAQKSCVPEKQRWLDGDRIVWRSDNEHIRPPSIEVEDWRSETLTSLRNGEFSGCILSDYDKGFLDVATIQAIIGVCREKKIPVVADCKRQPEVYSGAVLKGNHEYDEKYHLSWTSTVGKFVVTRGADGPHIPGRTLKSGLPVVYRSHVGAGDCFAAILTLGLACGLTLEESATVAHSAGRCYVQKFHNAPVKPEEIAADLSLDAVPPPATAGGIP